MAEKETKSVSVYYQVEPPMVAALLT